MEMFDSTTYQLIKNKATNHHPNSNKSVEWVLNIIFNIILSLYFSELGW